MIEKDEGATIIMHPDEAEHLPKGLVVSSYADLSDMEKSLVDKAWDISKTAYCPYSNFPVGASILAENAAGERRIFVGHNIENASYGGTMCAERTAAFEAVKLGFRKFLTVVRWIVANLLPDSFGPESL